jgi:polysaccharide pyruvyl transferase WcaK-like protein
MSNDNVAVLGWYGHSNIGDEAYKIAFPKIFPEINFTFQDKLEKRPECVILGGGDVIQPDFIKQINKFPEIPCFAMSVNLTSANYGLCKRFNKLFVRNFVQDIKNVEFMPDFTFVLTPDPQHGRELIEKQFNLEKAHLYEKVIVVTMNSYLSHGDNQLARDYINFERVCFEIAHVIDGINASVLLLPFGNGYPLNDRINNAFLYSKCKWWQKNLLVLDKFSVQDTLDIISAANVVIGTRLHSLIFACISGTPFIDLQHHSKTRFFLESIGKTEWTVDYWHFSSHKLNEIVADLLESEQIYRKELLEITNNNRHMLSKLPKFYF